MDVELAVAGLQDMGPVVTLLGKGSVFDLDSVLDSRGLGLLGVDSVGGLGEVHPDSLEEVRRDCLEGGYLDNDRHLVFEVNLLGTHDQGIRMSS